LLPPESLPACPLSPESGGHGRKEQGSGGKTVDFPEGWKKELGGLVAFARAGGVPRGVT